ncbi:MAG: hypothetical protein JW712_13815 [Dehalococcoidales bacterium]|nr:hypothetical protein [Dehalococcoidales bacterium]
MNNDKILENIQDDREISIHFDTASRSYYIVWQPMFVVATGLSEKEALEDLRETAHAGIDTIIDMYPVSG